MHFTFSVILAPEVHNIAEQLDNDKKHSLRSFANYFYTWISGAYYPIILWNHFTNDGPRTTNHIESYHSVLNKNDMREMHSSLKNFLTKLQLMHNRF